jgi:hypothetical protein
MSSSRTHRTVGAVSGAGYALSKARSQDPVHMVLEIIGGAVGGGVGGQLPDFIDPPLSLTPAGLPLLA